MQYKNILLKKDVYNAKIKNIEDKASYITNLATNTTLNAKINVVKTKYLVLLTWKIAVNLEFC